MAIPLLSYAPTCQNARVEGYEVGGDQQFLSHSLDNVTDDTDLDNLIEAAYRQIFFHAFKSDREPSLESQLRNGQISVRQFIRGLLLSDTYTRAFYGLNSNYRCVEQTVQRVLGRDVYSEAEKISWSIIIASKGLQGFVDALLESDDYLDAFGENTVPYQRRRVIDGRDQGETPFNIQSPRYDAYYRSIFGFPQTVYQNAIRRFIPQEKQVKAGDPAEFLTAARSLPSARGVASPRVATANINMSSVPYRKLGTSIGPSVNVDTDEE
ncbi:MAG: phycobilisome rod-core linker polypeptide CpcG [Spirulina sp. SIO3F2]|nr:phycobilisome rod-core linker polypeptide CpcG [Spirulina sp. SIO3F2]